MLVELLFLLKLFAGNSGLQLKDWLVEPLELVVRVVNYNSVEPVAAAVFAAAIVLRFAQLVARVGPVFALKD